MRSSLPLFGRSTPGIAGLSVGGPGFDAATSSVVMSTGGATSAALGNGFVGPGIGHGLADAALDEEWDLRFEPCLGLSSDPEPLGVRGYLSDMPHPAPMTVASSGNVECGLQPALQPATQDCTPRYEETRAPLPSSPKSRNHDLDSSIQFDPSTQNIPPLYGRLQSRRSPAPKDQRRQRNSIAARKYRQKRLDRIEELEQSLAATEKERDSLRVQLECWKTKAKLLQELMAGSKGDVLKKD